MGGAEGTRRTPADLTDVHQRAAAPLWTPPGCPGVISQLSIIPPPRRHGPPARLQRPDFNWNRLNRNRSCKVPSPPAVTFRFQPFDEIDSEFRCFEAARRQTRNRVWRRGKAASRRGTLRSKCWPGSCTVDLLERILQSGSVGRSVHLWHHLRCELLGDVFPTQNGPELGRTPAFKQTEPASIQ